ncbi:MAG: polysaccharide biosynthesis/export family protein [Bacteroidales bacterium]|nr:polysaccharide biosynthesis/export family protein [Bacteroidales bacterium]
MKLIKTLLCAAAAIFMVASCNSVKEIPYFQDAEKQEGTNVNEISSVPGKAIKVKPEDKITIIVSSKDPELAALFNLPIYSNQVGVPGISASSQQSASYTIDVDGNIMFPVLGKLHISGLTRSEISELISDRLIREDLIKDPTVSVEFLNLKVSVLGEVTKPGVYNITHDSFTIYDAIAVAGDLTIYGIRKDIQVIRTENGVQKVYHLNINSAEEMTSSEGFYLQQNDVIYVKPNKMRARQATVNGNNVLSASFWVSIASLTATIISIVLQSAR